MQLSCTTKIPAVARTLDSTRYTDPSAAASDAFAADADTRHCRDCRRRCCLRSPTLMPAVGTEWGGVDCVLTPQFTAVSAVVIG